MKKRFEIFLTTDTFSAYLRVVIGNLDTNF